MCQESIRPILQVLPVKLGSFTARQNGCNINLNWNSITELSLNAFVVEYSTDGRNYRAVGTVTGRGDNSVYNFAHQPAAGRAYYRLKMTDLDGQFKFSSVIAMNASCKGKNLLIYPNPASSLVNVNLSGYTGTVSGKLYNNLGQLMLTRVLLNGTNSIATERLANGTYALIVGEEKGEQQVYKIQVAH
jgi:Secretion system C-terminal sorting domain